MAQRSDRRNDVGVTPRSPGTVRSKRHVKAGDRTLTSLAHEFAPKVRVNTLSAGPFLTEIAKSWSEEQLENVPNAMGRAGQPDEVVTSALFFASPHSSFVTGALLRCDGGI